MIEGSTHWQGSGRRRYIEDDLSAARGELAELRSEVVQLRGELNTAIALLQARPARKANAKAKANAAPNLAPSVAGEA